MDNRAEVANLRIARDVEIAATSAEILSRENADVSDEATRLYYNFSLQVRASITTRARTARRLLAGRSGPRAHPSLGRRARDRERRCRYLPRFGRRRSRRGSVLPRKRAAAERRGRTSGAARRKSSMTMKRNEWFTRMREYWLKSRRSEALVVALHALRPLPTELRQRVVKQAEDLEWRSFIAENKHRFQTVPARHKDLTRELSKLGCGAIRSDSRLCKGFVNGSVTAKPNGQQWTAKRGTKDGRDEIHPRSTARRFEKK